MVRVKGMTYEKIMDDKGFLETKRVGGKKGVGVKFEAVKQDRYKQ